MTHSAPDPSHEHGSVYDGLLGTDASQWAFGTDFEDPLAGVDTTMPEGVDRRAGGVLPDARRRRAGDVAPALRVVQPRARPRGGHRAGQHRARPARPGPAAAGPRGRRGPDGGAGAAGGLAGAGRGRAGVLPRGRRLPQRPAGRGRERRLRPHDRPAAAVRDRPARAVRAAASASRDPVLAAVAAKGVKELGLPPRLRRPLVPDPGAGHRRVAAPAARRRWPQSGRCTPSCSPPTGRGRSPTPASASTRRPSPTRSRWCSSRCSRSAASSVPSRAAGRRPRPHRPRRAAHRGARAGCSPRCRSSPAPTRRGCGEHRARTRGRGRRSPTRRCRC